MKTRVRTVLQTTSLTLIMLVSVNRVQQDLLLRREHLFVYIVSNLFVYLVSNLFVYLVSNLFVYLVSSEQIFELSDSRSLLQVKKIRNNSSLTLF